MSQRRDMRLNSQGSSIVAACSLAGRGHRHGVRPVRRMFGRLPRFAGSMVARGSRISVDHTCPLRWRGLRATGRAGWAHWPRCGCLVEPLRRHAGRPSPTLVTRAAGTSSSNGSTSTEAHQRLARHSGLSTSGEDTIVAVVTQSGAGSVSILRISGEEAVPVARKLFRPSRDALSASVKGSKPQWAPRAGRVHYGRLVDGNGRMVDEVLLLFMRAPRSYTCEDVVELHCHGGQVTVQRVLQACLSAGCRLARPGEFTLRAFLNGRLDLAQAEAVQQLISARTVAAADSALAGLNSGVGDVVQELRMEVLDMVAELEARLDFEEDLPAFRQGEFVARLARIEDAVRAALATAQLGQLMDKGLQVAILGRPNVGKSSLMNRWTNTDRAIVTDIAGTTRDIVEGALSVGGVPVTLLDTAGIRSTADAVETIGVERARRAARDADLVLWVVNAAEGVTDDDFEVLRSIRGAGGAAPGPGSTGGAARAARAPVVLGVANKVDLAPDFSVDRIPAEAAAGCQGFVAISAMTGFGIKQLDDKILEMVGAPGMAAGGVGWAVNARQAEALTRAAEALERVQESVTEELPEDFWTVDLRDCLVALGEITGDDVTEEVLDSIFSRFCIGK